MEAGRIQARAVAKIVITALAVIAGALVLVLIVLNARTTLRWVVAAIFLALALAPAVQLVERGRIRGRSLPRWLAIIAVYLGFAVFFVFVVLVVIPPIVREIAALASKLPTYISDFENWAEQNDKFRELNDKYHITSTLTDQAKNLPSHLGGAATEARDVTVTLVHNLIAAITILAIAFFLLLDRGQLYLRAVGRLPGDAAERGRRIGEGVYRVVRSYVTVTVLLAVAAGVFTWLMLELLGVPLAVPLAVLVGFLDLIPLIGLTLGGLLVAIAAALTDFPIALIVWGIAFLVYQQLQDRVIQPVLFRGGAVRLNPAISIISVLIGAELLGILGALIAIPVGASIGVVFNEVFPPRTPEPPPRPAPESA